MDTPKYDKLGGKGIFSCVDFSFESSFILLRNPFTTVLLAEGDYNKVLKSFFSDSNTSWMLSGTLDDGRPIKAESLLFTGIPHGEHCFEFNAQTGVLLGTRRELPPSESMFPLVNYFNGGISLHHGEWEIITEEGENKEKAQDIVKRWHLPIEGTMLKLMHPDASTSEHLKMAISVMTLASLATGTGVTSHRHFFSWEDRNLETWRYMTGDQRGPGPIVPDFEMTSYFQTALPHFETLTPERKKALRLAISYINQSASGYLDTRLFHITQPWEFLAQTWNHDRPLAQETQNLRSHLKQVLKKWRKNHVDSEPDGFLGARVLSVFEWPKLKGEIEQLSETFGIDLHRFGLNLDRLKDARDNVAHSGRLPESLTGSNLHAFELLKKAQRCLQLLILRILGYDGRVYEPKGGWQSVVNMKEALKNKND